MKQKETPRQDIKQDQTRNSGGGETHYQGPYTEPAGRELHNLLQGNRQISVRQVYSQTTTSIIDNETNEFQQSTKETRLGGQG